MWCIYKHTNKINGKVYIGQTCQGTDGRWRNGKGYQSKSNNSIFWNAIKKYGWNNFDHQIIENNISTQEEANNREIHWIYFYRSYVGFVNSNGYNMTLGGHNCQHLGKKVYQIDKNNMQIINIFDSIADASLSLGGKCAGSIGRCCRDLEVSAKGYYWCFADNYSDKWIPKINENASPIFQIDRNTLHIIKKYEKISDAYREGYTSSIISCLQRKQKTACGYCWCYCDEYDNNWVPAKMKFERNQRIYCYDTDTVYPSAKEASKATGCNRDKILRCCNSKELHTGGKQFCFLPDIEHKEFDKNLIYQKQEDFTEEEINVLKEIYPNEGITEKLLKLIPHHSKDSIKQKAHRLGLTVNFIPQTRNSKKVLCVEQNKIFNSIKDACKFVKLKNNSNITKCCKGQRHTAGGYHWKYVD